MHKLAFMVGVSVLAITQSSAARADCSVNSNVTITTCDTTSVVVVPGSGTSSLTVDSLSTNGVFYSPTATSGVFTETLTVSGPTTIANGTYTGVNGGAGITMQQIDNIVGNQVTLNSTAIIDSGVTINSNAQYGGAVYLRTEGTGNLSITNAGSVTVTGVDGSNNPVVGAADGLTAVTGLGSSTVINSGTVVSNGRGLYSEGNSLAVVLDNNGNVTSTVGPSVTVSASNLVGGSVNATLAAIRVINYYGLATASNDGYLNSATRQAMVAWSDDGDATVTNTGTAIASDRNAVVAATEYGNATATNSGTITASMAAQNTQGAGIGYSGIRAYADFQGNVTITNTATGTITANNDAALVAHTPQGNITVTNNGSLTGQNGIFADAGLGTGSTNSIDTINDTSATVAQTTGSATITNTGTIQATNVGVYANATSAAISNSGSITGGTFAIVSDSNSTTITNSGTISGNIQLTGSTANLAGGDTVRGLFTGGTITTASDVTITGGQITLDDNVSLTSGTGTLTNNGNIALGATHTLSGNFVNTGTYVALLSSPSAYGQLNISGTASFGGVLDVEVGNGFYPTLGETFTLFDYASETGNFSAFEVNGTTCTTSGNLLLNCGDYIFNETVSPGNLTLTTEFVPEPASIAVIGVGVAGLGALRRRKRKSA